MVQYDNMKLVVSCGTLLLLQMLCGFGIIRKYDPLSLSSMRDIRFHAAISLSLFNMRQGERGVRDEKEEKNAFF